MATEDPAPEDILPPVELEKSPRDPSYNNSVPDSSVQ